MSCVVRAFLTLEYIEQPRLRPSYANDPNPISTVLVLYELARSI
jgi:hypothetical protein